MALLSYLRGDDILSSTGESRALTRENVPAAMLPYSRRALLDVSEAQALRVAAAYACVRVLSDAVASLPAKVYRRTPAGRVPAGDDQRLVQLLRTPSPGSTASDLFGQVMVDLNTRGNAYVGKFRSEGTVPSLSLLHPDRVQVELGGAWIVYTLDGQSEHGPEDILHIKGMSADGLTGLSPVAQCWLALILSSNLQEHARQYFEQVPGRRESSRSEASSQGPRAPAGGLEGGPRRRRADAPHRRDRGGHQVHADRRQPHLQQRARAEQALRDPQPEALARADRARLLERRRPVPGRGIPELPP